MALNSFICADVPLANYSLTHWVTHWWSADVTWFGDVTLSTDVMVMWCGLIPH